MLWIVWFLLGTIGGFMFSFATTERRAVDGRRRNEAEPPRQ